MVSKGGRGAEPPLLVTVLGANPLNSSFIGFAFPSVLTLLSKFFVLVWSILHCCMVIKKCLVVYYTTSVSN